MGDTNRGIERIATLSEQGVERNLCAGTAADRWGNMWQLAVDAWATKGEHVAEDEFRRDVERIIRGGAASQ